MLSTDFTYRKGFEYVLYTYCMSTGQAHTVLLRWCDLLVLMISEVKVSGCWLHGLRAVVRSGILKERGQ